MGFQLWACPLHQTAEEHAFCTLLEEFDHTHRQRFEKAKRQWRATLLDTEARYQRQVALREHEIDRLRAELARLKPSGGPTLRMEHNGAQVVEVSLGDRHYAYCWQDTSHPLHVGDWIVLPENWFSRQTHGTGPFEAQVSALGTLHAGELSPVISRA